MPYIDKSDREYLEGALMQLESCLLDMKNLHNDANGSLTNVGVLNYAITRLVSSWFDNQPRKYHDYNAAIGVLECAKQEFYRRQAAPYEDEKCEQNGDVYDIPFEG